jgi:hypothetical protein
MDKILSCGSFQPLDVELTVDLAGKKLRRALEKATALTVQFTSRMPTFLTF